MPVIPLVPSDSPTLISSLLRLSAHHLAPSFKSGRGSELAALDRQTDRQTNGRTDRNTVGPMAV